MMASVFRDVLVRPTICPKRRRVKWLSASCGKTSCANYGNLLALLRVGYERRCEKAAGQAADEASSVNH